MLVGLVVLIIGPAHNIIHKYVVLICDICPILQAYIVGIHTAFLIIACLVYLGPKSNPKIAKVQQTLRVPLHMATHIGGCLVFVVCTQSIESVTCSPFWPEYCAVEGLVMHLVWPACYCALAVIPFSLAVPLQLLACGIYVFHNGALCRNAPEACPLTPEQYHMLHGVFSKIGAAVPFSIPNKLESPIKSDCLAVLTVLEISILVILSFYLSFAVEISSRIAYCVTAQNSVEAIILELELLRRRIKPLQLLGEALLMCLLVWNIVDLVFGVWSGVAPSIR